MEKITENVYAATDILGCNPGYVATSDGIVLIDTPQLPSKAVELREKILRNEPIRFLINTEHHIDHIFGNFFFAGKCSVIGHEDFLRHWGITFTGESLYPFMMDLIEKWDPQGADFMPSEENLILNPPDMTFSNRLTIRVGEHVFQLFNTPGHTKGQIAVYVPREKILFTGDTIFCECQTWFRSADIDAWLCSLDFLSTLDIDYIIPGHGPICSKNYIFKQSAFIREWVTAVADGIAKGWSKEECMKRISFLDRLPMDIGLDSFGPKVNRINVEQIFDYLQERIGKFDRMDRKGLI